MPNSIKTAKYNVITFVPIFLVEMFSRVAYLYFLAQVTPSTFSPHPKLSHVDDASTLRGTALYLLQQAACCSLNSLKCSNACNAEPVVATR